MSDVIFNPNEKEYKSQHDEIKVSIISRLIMKFSGGFIKNQDQVNNTLIGITISAVIITAIILIMAF